jgi:hypothetical protein
MVGMEMGWGREVRLTVVDFARSELGGWECDARYPKAVQVVVVTSIQLEGVRRVRFGEPEVIGVAIHAICGTCARRVGYEVPICVEVGGAPQVGVILYVGS